MSFCSGATSAIKKVMNEVTPWLGKTIDEITKITGLVKRLKESPEIGELIKIIPGGSNVEKWLNTALDEITGVTESTQNLAEKLNEWLSASPSSLDRNSRLAKLASVAAKVADVEAGNDAKAEHVYDSATLLRIIADKAVATEKK